MTKKIFIVFVVIFLLTSLVFIIQSLSSEESSILGGEFNSEGTEEIIGEEAVEGGIKKQPEDGVNVNVGKISKLVDSKDGDVKGATLNLTTEQVLYYQKRNFLLTDFKGNAKNSIGAYPFVDIKELKWNLTKEKALIRDQGAYFVYDLNKNEIIELAIKIDYAVWFKDEEQDKLAYKFYDGETGKRKIAIADFNGENEEILIEDLAYKRVAFKIPLEGNKVCYHREADANLKAGLDCINIKTKQIEIIHKGSFAADYKWANNGNRLLTSYVDEQIGNKMVLGVMNGKGGEFKSLNFPTSVDKCVWSKDNKKVYCGMMIYTEKDIILPNDWSSGKHNSTDTFWEIEVGSGKKRRLLESSETIPIDAEALFLDNSENYLFFTDRKTKSVYSISLK